MSELAQAMGISVSQIYRVKQSKRGINQKFITGAIEAFPGYKFDDLFYLVAESPTVTSNYPRRGAIEQHTAKEKQGRESTEQALEKSISA